MSCLKRDCPVFLSKILSRPQDNLSLFCKNKQNSVFFIGFCDNVVMLWYFIMNVMCNKFTFDHTDNHTGEIKYKYCTIYCTSYSKPKFSGDEELFRPTPLHTVIRSVPVLTLTKIVTFLILHWINLTCMKICESIYISNIFVKQFAKVYW